jgi:integrase
MWQAFADHHRVSALPADPLDVAAFVVARRDAGVSRDGIAANLSAVAWFHGRSGPGMGDVTAAGRAVLKAASRDGAGRPRRPAPVLSVGALLAMAGVLPAQGASFAARVLRWSLPSVKPRQLAAVTGADVSVGPAGEWAELQLPAVAAAGRHPALPPAVVRLAADPGWLACPVRAVRQLTAAAGSGPLCSPTQLFGQNPRGFNPTVSPDGIGARLQVRDAAIVCVGYAGALRVEELARARLEDIEPLAGGYRLRIPQAKTSRSMPAQAAVLDRRDDGLDPVAALDRWLAVRGDGDGPLFTALHHRAPGRVAAGTFMPAGDLRDVIGQLAVRAGLPSTVSGYSLRRSWATHRYLSDPNDLGGISLQLRHASIDMTVRYVEDLRVHHLQRIDMLSADRVLAGPGGQPAQRRDLGFAPTPLAELRQRASVLQAPRAALAPATRRINDAHWSSWHRFAQAAGWPALPARPEALGLFFAERADQGLRPHYLDAQLRTILRRHADAGHPPGGLAVLAEEILDAYSRSAPWTARKAPIITLGDLTAMAAAAAERDGLEALRDRVLLCVGYCGAMRVDDLRRARLDDVERTPWGVLLRLRSSKDDPAGISGDAIVLPSRADVLDPVAALRDLAAATGRSSGPLLPTGRGADRPMTAEAVTERLRFLARTAGVRATPGGHSLRRSWATHAYEAGVDLVTIQRHLRHSAPSLTKGYVASLSPWLDNPAVTLAAEPASPGQPDEQGVDREDAP